MSFLERFVHPRLAAVAVGGVLLWVASFLVAAAGVGAEHTGSPTLGVNLLFWSGVVGLLGTVVLVACGLWLLGLRVVRAVGG